MILDKMLQRLYAGLARGPGLNARPQNSRLRIDVMELQALGGLSPEAVLPLLLGGGKGVEFPAKVPVFVESGSSSPIIVEASVPVAAQEISAPVVGSEATIPVSDQPEAGSSVSDSRPAVLPTPAPVQPAPPKGKRAKNADLSREDKVARSAYEAQSKLLRKLRDVVEDATDYYNDHGEQALFVGYPLLSIPVQGSGQRGFASGSGRILAPIAFTAVNLSVRREAKPGVTLQAVGETADWVIPNPALMAWLEQRTGEDTDDLFGGENAEKDAWRTLEAIVKWVCRAAEVDYVPFTAETKLLPVPKTDDLPKGKAVLPSAVLGLFPQTNPGLLRDTKWMQQNELALVSPTRKFLSLKAIESDQVDALPAAGEWDHTAPHAALRRDFAQEWLVTHSDPCQTAAVKRAQSSEALVIHGPPGTGKSQTISNIIGDHLARGQKVLFVCDKRTALDVVKYRLDSMGLGHLCGVIHDPTRDRRDFYMALRQQLEDLNEMTIGASHSYEHNALCQRLNERYGELHNYYQRLHGASDGQPSFHDLTGRWFDLRSQGAGVLRVPAGLTVAMVTERRTDAEEVLRRSIAAQWKSSPFRGKLAIGIDTFLAISPQTIEQQFVALEKCAAEVDALAHPGLIPCDPLIPGPVHIAGRRQLADALDAVASRADQPLVTAMVSIKNLKPVADELAGLSDEIALIESPLERDLFRAIKGSIPSIAEINIRLQAIAEFLPFAGTWQDAFCLFKKPRATEALAPLGLTPLKANLLRAESFYKGLRARVSIAAVRQELLRTSDGGGLPDDDTLSGFIAGFRAIEALLTLKGKSASAPLWPHVEEAQRDIAGKISELTALLRQSADRREKIATFEATLRSTQLFAAEVCAKLIADLCANGSARAAIGGFREYLPVLEDSVRLTCRLAEMPPPLHAILEDAIAHGMDWKRAEPEMLAAALSHEIQEKIRTNTELARIDTARVESAFAELLDGTARKQDLVRALVAEYWRARAKTRLLAVAGTRLNSIGASLRQRLFVRGKNAMKLRQMLAAGAEVEGGDPIFDLCPVWMASPSTVAQIFPRETIFDVIIFDEASQCRLEEALPVLLRGKRVVVAGDPKQLPPTRFFEQALADSDDTAPETTDEVFEHVQGEAEDLLTATLNLDVEEAFLDVHYRSNNEALIAFSNDSFYSSRLQPIPGHPKNRAAKVPIRLTRVDGVYKDRTNEDEARAAARLVRELLDTPNPPSIGIACFNITQRDTILDALDKLAAEDSAFAELLQTARKRRGRDSFEGLFVKNLENVQGDERDHMIISTTFGRSPEGQFRRNFGALSRAGGERRLNVLVTRARHAIHLFTSIPRAEYLVPEDMEDARAKTGRHFLYDYLRFAESLETKFNEWQDDLETAQRNIAPSCHARPTASPSGIAEGIGKALLAGHEIGSTVYWGTDGFCIDAALTHPELPADVTIGVLADFTRFRKTPDPILWEQFRTIVLTSQGWHLHRIWSPALFRDPTKVLTQISDAHDKASTAEPESLDPVPSE
ncbi:DNA helicase [Verrucomicrobia bacterium LW23]|nr:DNA helicase [Verrucomicrobia bacterium LW23]